MPITPITLTGNVHDRIGNITDTRRTKVWIVACDANGPIARIADPDSNEERFGNAPADVATDGTYTFTDLWPTNAATSPSDYYYEVIVDYPLARGVGGNRGNGGRDLWRSGPFELTASATMADLDLDVPAITATWRSAFRDEMQAVATVAAASATAAAAAAELASDLVGADTADELIATVDADPGSALRIQQDARHAASYAAKAVQTTVETGRLSAATLDATIAADITDSTETGGAVWKVGPTQINVRQHGVASTNTAAQNDAAMAALFAEHTNAVFVAFPDRGTFNFSAPLPARNHLQVSGRGRQTILNWTAGNMVLVSGSTLMQSAVFRDAQITNSGTASHLFDVSGTGGFIHTTFERCNIKPGVNGASILKANIYNLFGLTFRDCLLMRNTTATVPAFDIVGQAGAGTNNIHIEGGEWHSYECASTPFFRADTDSGSPIVNMTFEKIIGEQNHGGMIHVGGAAVVRVKNVIDYDSSAYADDLFRFGTGTGGATSNAVDIDMSGSYGSATLAGGKAHLRISGGTAHRVGWIPKNASQSGTVVTPTKGATVRRDSGAEVPPYEAVASLPVTMTLDQHTVIVGATGTITLPASAPAGQRFVIKAVAGGGCTVSGGGLTIDGSATRALAQYEWMTVVSNGTAWLRI
ncbi:hypothetical protein [Nocardioides terrigena]|uniref:hypothetical protein n=1 Tax=Nocardioides terrigena TaxID=424797 RepID=UPI000D32714C|nr:hypothetical protein [Nocardioides terrigena]